MAHNFPVYSWFDPMTAYPDGKTIDWGPLLAFVGSGITILSGTTTRAGMMNLVSWVGPVFAILLVPVMYFVGKYIGDWRTGIIAAGLVVFLSPFYFVNTSFGYFEHHGPETFFSTLFCLMYIVTLTRYKKILSGERNVKNKIYLIGLSLVTGLVYFIGYLNMPTIILFGLIVALFTFFQVIVNTVKARANGYLLFTNLGVFLPVLCLMLLFGTKQPGISLQQYTFGQIIAISALVVESILLYALSERFGSDRKTFFPSIAGMIVLGLAINTFLFGNLFTRMLIDFFGQGLQSSTISQEAPWNIAAAINSFNFAIILALAGFFILLSHYYVKNRNRYLFLIIWSSLSFFATLQHMRYEYYFVVNVAILSSICIVAGFDTGLFYLKTGEEHSGKLRQTPAAGISGAGIRSTSRKTYGRKKGEGKEHKIFLRLKGVRIVGGLILACIVLLTIPMVVLSVQNDVRYATSTDQLMNKDWVVSLEWLQSHSPDPGVNYLGLYNQKNFSYPQGSYGVLSWWDYGHYITFISKRIPNTNPFQDNLMGPSGAAAFFLTGSESNATKILDNLGTRYIITDTSLTTTKFADIADWYSAKSGTDAYLSFFYMADPQQPGRWIQLKDKLRAYYRTTVVRLQNFDGSRIVPGKTVYAEYYVENQSGTAYQVVTNYRFLNQTDTKQEVTRFNVNPVDSRRATELGQYLNPVTEVPALRHFRLVYESPGDSSALTFTDFSNISAVHYVKIFEYVQGAHIKGNGTIELHLVTNTGRTFTYSQDSINGEFVVPYSTVNNPYDVKATGKYHIDGTDREIDVREKDIINGSEITE